MSQPTSQVSTSRRTSSMQSFWRKWLMTCCLPCCSGTTSSSLPSYVTTNDPGQLNMDRTGSLNDLSTDQGVLLEQNAEPEPVTSASAELDSANSEPMEVKATLNEPPELKNEMMPGPSKEPTEPSPVDTENGQIKKNPLLDILQDLVPKQVMPTDTSENESASILDENCTEDIPEAAIPEILEEQQLPPLPFGDLLFVPTGLQGTYGRVNMIQQALQILFSWYDSNRNRTTQEQLKRTEALHFLYHEYEGHLLVPTTKQIFKKQTVIKNSASSNLSEEEGRSYLSLRRHQDLVGWKPSRLTMACRNSSTIC